MALSPALEDRELNKFLESGGQTAVAVYDLASGTSPSNKSIILAAADYERAFTWANFGTKNERVTQIAHTAPTTLPGVTMLETFSYTLTSGAYRLDSITWSEV